MEEAPTESGDADPKKKLLGPAPKVKVDVFGRAMDPEVMHSGHGVGDQVYTTLFYLFGWAVQIVLKNIYI